MKALIFVRICTPTIHLAQAPTLLGSTGLPLICTTGPGWVLHFLQKTTGSLIFMFTLHT